MKEEDKKLSYNSKSFFLLAFFLFYLVYMDGTISGNSILLGMLGIISMIIGLLKVKAIHRLILQHIGIVEVDLEKKKDKK